MIDHARMIEAMDEYDKRPKCALCGRPKRTNCNEGWLDAIGPKSDGSYITSRPCPQR